MTGTDLFPMISMQKFNQYYYEFLRGKNTKLWNFLILQPWKIVRGL